MLGKFPELLIIVVVGVLIYATGKIGDWGSRRSKTATKDGDKDGEKKP